MNENSQNKHHQRGGRGVARHKTTPHPKRRKAVDDYFWNEITHYYDTEEFKDYCQTVLSVIGKIPLSVREIKILLGENLIEKWLADALDMIEDKLEIKHSIPTKYSKK